MSFRIPPLIEESEETYRFETLEQSLANGARAAYNMTNSSTNLNMSYQFLYMAEDSQMEVDSSRLDRVCEIAVESTSCSRNQMIAIKFRNRPLL
jgi:hypothetical protein